ncbi:hypothetical protein pb186bvf_013646 [Paramecium bursaria]
MRRKQSNQKEYLDYLQMQIQQKERNRRESKILQLAEEQLISRSQEKPYLQKSRIISDIQDVSVNLGTRNQRTRSVQHPDVRYNKSQLKYDLQQQIEEKKLKQKMEKIRQMELDLKEELKYQRTLQKSNMKPPSTYNLIVDSNFNKNDLSQNSFLEVPSRYIKTPSQNQRQIQQKLLQDDFQSQIRELRKQMFEYQTHTKQQIDSIIDFARFNQSQADQYYMMQQKLKPLILNPSVDPLLKFLKDEQKERQNRMNKDYLESIEPYKQEIQLHQISDLIYLQPRQDTLQTNESIQIFDF